MNLLDLERRLDWVERMIATCKDPKSLPALNETYQKLIDRLVALDLAGLDEEPSDASQGKRSKSYQRRSG